MTLVCVVLGWVGYQLNWIRQRRQATIYPMGVGGVQAPGALWIFGEEGVSELHVGPAYYERTRALFPEAKIHSFAPEESGEVN